MVLHIAVILAGFTGVFGKLVSLNEGLLVWYRVLFSAVILYFILKLSKTNTNIAGKEKLTIAMIGMILTVHWLFFYASIKYSNISVGVVCYCLTSFFTAIFEPLINKKPFSFLQLFLSGLTLFGISLIFHFDVTYQLGIALGIISSAFAALYTIYNERLVKKYENRLSNYYQMLGGTIGLGILLPVYLYYFPATQFIPGTKDAFYLFILALFCTVGLYLLFAEALKKIPAFTVNLTFSLEPVYSIILAFLFFDESKEVNASFYVGLFFVMLSVILQTIITLRNRRNKPEPIAAN